MFYDLVMKNSKRTRKENGLFFASLIVSIISFYIILALEKQDAIIFLKTMESQAVEKLFLLIPVLYGFSLFILFFLVYFAGKYQLDRRGHELGMYLMLGMKRSKLFLMLFAEELWNSIISLAIGIPAAIFLSEIISLVTAKVIGIGVIGHEFSFSLSAIIGTIIGYFIIRLIALGILSGKFFKKDITELLSDSQVEKHRKINKAVISIQLVLGVILLAVAYARAIIGTAWEHTTFMGITVILGLCGTFLIFHGIGILFEMILTKKQNKNGLVMFTFRQLQEFVFSKPNTLAISSLLILMALCCFGYGLSVGFISNSKEPHVIDYTFNVEEQVLKSELERLNLQEYIDELSPIKAGIYFENESTKSFSIDGLIKAVKKQEDGENKEILLKNLQYATRPYLISIDGYNKLLQLAGKEQLVLKDNEVALYNDPEFSNSNSMDILEKALKDKPFLKIGNESYELVDKYYKDSIVTDSLITISYGLIVPEKVFNKFTDKNNVTTYWNATLTKKFVKDEGLMQAISKVNEKLNTTDLHYESYLQNMGRELFYRVAASYTTIYLAIIFLIIANTVMGVQFLMQQQKARKHYQSLIYIGATYKMLCKSARSQITWYFSLSLVVATISSIFGVRSLFTGVMTTAMKSQVNKLMLISIPVIILLSMVEFSYMVAVKKISDKSILKLTDIKREDS